MGNPNTEGRMIRKKIADSDDFSSISPPAAVLFCMIIPQLNAHGKLQGGPAFIKEIVCPKITYLTIENIPEYMKEISDNTDVKWFQHDKRFWIHALHFTDHQNLNPQRIGKDTLPDYSGVSQELVKSKSGVNKTSQELVVHEVEEEVEEEVEGEVEGPKQPRPVDNSEPEYPPFDSVTSQPEKEKAALTEKTNKPPEEKSSLPGDDNTELRELMAKVKTKHPRLAIDSWYGKNMKAHPLAIIHVLKSLLKNGDDADYPFAYLQSALNVENGKYNARDSESEHEVRKKPIPGEMQNMRQILAQVGM